MTKPIAWKKAYVCPCQEPRAGAKYRGAHTVMCPEQRAAKARSAREYRKCVNEGRLMIRKVISDGAPVAKPKDISITSKYYDISGGPSDTSVVLTPKVKIDPDGDAEHCLYTFEAYLPPSQRLNLVARAQLHSMIASCIRSAVDTVTRKCELFAKIRKARIVK